MNQDTQERFRDPCKTTQSFPSVWSALCLLQQNSLKMHMLHLCVFGLMWVLASWNHPCCHQGILTQTLGEFLHGEHAHSVVISLPPLTLVSFQFFQEEMASVFKRSKIWIFQIYAWLGDPERNCIWVTQFLRYRLTLYKDECLPH